MFSSRRDRALERQLRVGRPQPRDSFVGMLAERVPARRSERRRGVVPRVIVVATVTASVAVALGATGAVSYASGSLHSLSSNISHVVAPSRTASPLLSFSTGASSKGFAGSPGLSGFGNGGGLGLGNGGGGGLGNLGSGGGQGLSGIGDPFNFVYGLRIPTCQGGKLVYVTLAQYIYDLLHGSAPQIGIFCSTRG
jgi:hypothetical protein